MHRGNIARKYLTERAGVVIVEGWEDIAAVMGIVPRTAQRYERIPRDPLPVRRSDVARMVWIELDELTGWMERHGLL